MAFAPGGGVQHQIAAKLLRDWVEDSTETVEVPSLSSFLHIHTVLLSRSLSASLERMDFQPHLGSPKN